MSLLEKIRFGWAGEDMIADLIKHWKPKQCRTEKQYELSLYEHLHENLDEIQVTKQFANGRVRADIMVGDRIIVELKNNLDAMGKYQRLIGQLDSYKSWSGSVFVLLCGKSDQNLLKELRQYVKNQNNRFDFTAGEKFRLIVKG